MTSDFPCWYIVLKLFFLQCSYICPFVQEIGIDLYYMLDTIPRPGTTQISKTDSVLSLMELTLLWGKGDSKQTSKYSRMLVQMVGNATEKIMPAPGTGNGCLGLSAESLLQGHGQEGAGRRHCPQGSTAHAKGPQEPLGAAPMAGAQRAKRSVVGAGSERSQGLPPVFAGLAPVFAQRQESLPHRGLPGPQARPSPGLSVLLSWPHTSLTGDILCLSQLLYRLEYLLTKTLPVIRRVVHITPDYFPLLTVLKIRSWFANIFQKWQWVLDFFWGGFYFTYFNFVFVPCITMTSWI